MTDQVYLDFPSSTPLDAQVLEKMVDALQTIYANPANTSHAMGREARAHTLAATQQVAQFLGSSSEEIIWTSGATESNNLVVQGVVSWQVPSLAGRDEILTLATAHPSLLAPAREMAAQGRCVHRLLPVDGQGAIDEGAFAAALGPHTRLVSLMAANNETGALHDVARWARMARAAGAFVHCDATQAAGKIPIDVVAWDVDSLSFSGHKIYGPKGIAGLFVRQEHISNALPGLFYGNAPMFPIRPGTLNVPAIVGMAEACHQAGLRRIADVRHLEQMMGRLRQGLLAALDECYVLGPPSGGLPGLLNIAFAGVDANTLLSRMPRLALATGAACHGTERVPSHVLQAMQVPAALLFSALRIGVGRPTTTDDIDVAIETIIKEVRFLRSLSPQVPHHSGDER